MLEKFGMLSVNQIAAQIKLAEMWKCNNDEKYPLRIKKRRGLERETRPGTRRELEEGGKNNYRNASQEMLQKCGTKPLRQLRNQGHYKEQRNK